MLSFENLKKCMICPRRCGADRLNGEKGFCGVSGRDAYITRAALHFWEEPCISGEKGSGTVFFAGCNLHCIYCQNAAISGGAFGRQKSEKELSEIFLRLQEQGAENINLVTPTHYAVQIAGALSIAKDQGLQIPVVYNTGGYESVDTLREMAPYIDIYLTDAKYADAETAACYSSAEDYPEICMNAVEEMVRQQPECVFDGHGMMKRGVIVRHLVLPGHVRHAKTVVKNLFDRFGNSVFISIMNQYTPMRTFPEDPLLSRKLTGREYERTVDYALELGVTNAFIQEGGTAKESFIPPFDLSGV